MNIDIKRDNVTGALLWSSGCTSSDATREGSSSNTSECFWRPLITFSRRASVGANSTVAAGFKPKKPLRSLSRSYVSGSQLYGMSFRKRSQMQQTNIYTLTRDWWWSSGCPRIWEPSVKGSQITSSWGRYISLRQTGVDRPRDILNPLRTAILRDLV